jgi:hypothetical protein
MQHIIRAQVCGVCKHSKGLDAGSTGQYGPDTLLCKRFPPQRSSFIAGGGPQGPIVGSVSNWPEVGKHSEGCAEWTPRIIPN